MVNYMAMLKDVAKKAGRKIEDILELINLKIDNFPKYTETEALGEVAKDYGIYEYDTSLKGRVARVAKESGLSIDDINAQIMQQIDDLSGLIDETGAIVIVAKELGVKLHYDD